MALAHHYRILGLRTGASFEDVKLAYRNLARLYHPDTNPGDQLAKEKFIQVTQSYQALASALPQSAVRTATSVKTSPQPNAAPAANRPAPAQRPTAPSPTPQVNQPRWFPRRSGFEAIELSAAPGAFSQSALSQGGGPGGGVGPSFPQRSRNSSVARHCLLSLGPRRD